MLIGCTNIKTESNIKRLPVNDGIFRVYMILDGKEVMYVGKSINLRARFSMHKTHKMVNENSVVSFGECAECDVDEVESMNIIRLLPAYNGVIPTSSTHASRSAIMKTVKSILDSMDCVNLPYHGSGARYYSKKEFAQKLIADAHKRECK